MTNLKPKRGEVLRLTPLSESSQRKRVPLWLSVAATSDSQRCAFAVPVTVFQDAHAKMLWCVLIVPSAASGLTKPGIADASQVRTLDVARSEEKLGKLAPDDVATIAAVVLCVAHEAPTPGSKT